MSQEFNLYKYDYLNKISQTINLSNRFFIGYEDTIKKSLNHNSSSVLLFIFPFIERMLRFIMSYYPDFDIEVYSQGVHRTMSSLLILNEDKLKDVIGEDTISQLKSLFIGVDALRNLICHTSNINNLSVSELKLSKYILIRLIRVINGLNGENEINLVNEMTI